LPRERYSRISIESGADGPSAAELRLRIEAAGLAIVASRLSFDLSSNVRALAFDIRDMSRVANTRPPDLVEQLTTEPGIMKIQWRGPF
jgi:hypothetical protein